MPRLDPPAGHLRLAAGPLRDVATLAASGVPGVLSVDSLVRGAALGGAIGGTVGLVYGGPAGGVAGASVGTAVGAAAGAAAQRARRLALAPVLDRRAPDLDVAVVARYGQDLAALAGDVRAAIRAALRDQLGLDPGAVSVQVVDVVSPEIEMGGAR